LNKDKFPSIEDDGFIMRDIVIKLVQIPSVTKIIFIHNKNYEYEFNYVHILKEIAEIYSLLSKQKELFTAGQVINKNEECIRLFFKRYALSKY